MIMILLLNFLPENIFGYLLFLGSRQCLILPMKVHTDPGKAHVGKKNDIDSSIHNVIVSIWVYDISHNDQVAFADGEDDAFGSTQYQPCEQQLRFTLLKKNSRHLFRCCAHQKSSQIQHTACYDESTVITKG